MKFLRFGPRFLRFWRKMRLDYRIIVRTEGELDAIVNVRLRPLNWFVLLSTVLVLGWLFFGALLLYTPLGGICQVLPTGTGSDRWWSRPDGWTLLKRFSKPVAANGPSSEESGWGRFIALSRPAFTNRGTELPSRQPLGPQWLGRFAAPVGG